VRSYLLSCKKHGDPIPKPSAPASSSGQFRVRMPKSPHARLVAQADKEGVSLDMLMVAAAEHSQRDKPEPNHCDLQKIVSVTRFRVLNGIVVH
jgi:hypothetical protein